MWGNGQMDYAPQPRWQGGQMQRQGGYGGYGYNAQPQQVGNMQWIRVHSAQEAREVSVQPGCEAWIMEDERPVFYFKRADAMGQVTVKAFRFEEIGMESAASASMPDMSQYATKADLEGIYSRLERLDRFASAARGGAE